MYNNVTDAFKATIRSPSRTFRGRLKINDKWIYANFKKLSYETSSSSEEYLQLGSAVSAKIELSIKRIDELFENTEIPIEIGLKLPSGKYEYIPVGFFTAEHPTNDQATTTFTAYDRMMKTTGLYVSNLTYPASAVSVLNEISADCGVPVDVSNIDSSIMISTKPAGYTYREMIGYIASMAGGFACVDRTGTIVIKWYSDVDYKLDVTRIMSFEKDESNYNLEKLSCNVDNSTTLTSGGGILGVTFDNPFMTQDRLDNIFKKLSGFSYRGASVKTLGDVRLDSWDMITVEDGEDAYKVPVMNIQQEYDGGLAMTITSYGKTQTEQEVDFKGPTTQQNKRIYSDLILAKELIAKKVDAEWVKANTVQAETIVSINNDLENIRNNYLKSNVAEITYATIESLKSLSGEFADLKATDFEAIKASVKDLNVDVEKVNTLLFGSATGTTITTDFANSVVSVIGDAQITSAMIKELAFDKLTGIDINTTEMNVHSEDGKSMWKDNTIQISDKERVRVQLGKDASGDYNIYIWDKNGNLMFDPLYGIQESGIKKAIIRNDMVSDNAAISGKKLDIDSVFSVMNADKSNTFNASKIHVDTTDQTLESTFQTINNYVSGGSEAWGSTMLQSKTFIEHKLWWTDIDEEGNSVKSKFNDVKTTLDSFKIDMSDVTKQLSGTFEIYDVTGAPNLDNYPATEFFVPVYPAEDWYPLETDTWQYTQEEYAKHAGAIACMKSAGRYWKFLRQSNGKYGWTEISSSETAYMLNKHTAFQVAIDGITSEVSKVKVDIRDNYSTTTQMISRIVQEIKDDKSTISSSLQATYATQKYADDAANAATSGANNYTDNVLKTYSTTADIIQAISPGKTSISAAVTAKLGDYATSASLEAYIKKDPTTGELKSAIEAIADTINITARGGLNLSGNRFTLSSTNTSITADGTITCSNLIANGGNIGGWKVSKDSISTIFKQDNDLFRIALQIPGDITPYVFSVFHGTENEGYNKSPNFYISQTGKLYATNAQITGSGYFSSGTIGGWDISKSSIYKDYGKYRTYIQTPTNSGDWVFSCQEKRDETYYGNWYVRADGYMYASKGQIGNFSIDNGILSTYQNNGIKGMSIDQNYIKFYSWVDDYENYVGSITTTRYYTSNNEVRRALVLNADYGDVLGINCTKEKTENTEYEFVVRINDDLNKSLEFFSPTISMNGGFQNNVKKPTTLTVYCHNPNSGKDTQNVRITNTDDRHYENCELSVYGSTYIGYDLRCFGSIYGTIASDSDENVKKDVHLLNSEDSSEFIYNLKPCEFKMINGTSNRYHHGFIAQQVKETMKDDWGLFIDKKINNDNYETQVSDENGNTTKELTARYALRYDELIADLVATVQSQNMRIKKLEKQLSN